MKNIPRIRDVYREYELGRIPFDDVLAASERIIAQWEVREAESKARS
ncbi:MAG TPA: hypothetical protein PLX85_06250 [Dehalococcoidia bacterium]|nr:hypothetical protein [Dehalococcoidia bacterium]